LRKETQNGNGDYHLLEDDVLQVATNKQT